MARIPAEEIERLKRDVDLAALVRARGVVLKPHGKDLIGHCPFHDDREPSLVVTPSKNRWRCLGACGEEGDAISWVMKAEGVSQRHAVELLRTGRETLFTGTGRKKPKKCTVPKLPSPVEIEAADRELLLQVVDYYHDTLKRTPAALSYLEKRGIRSAEALDKFRLGFCDRTLGLRLPHRNRREGAEIRERLIALGIFRKSGHEHFRGSLVVPVIDGTGQVTEVYGRKINDHLRRGTAMHTYLPGPHRGVWNPECLSGEEVILCESLIDALTFWANGFRNVTSSYGTEGFTEEHLSGFLGGGVRRVFIAYDRDEEGDRAASKLGKRLRSEGIDCLRVKFPRGMDANEYARQVEPAEQSLGVLLRSAEWMDGERASVDTVGRDEPPKEENAPPLPAGAAAGPGLAFPPPHEESGEQEADPPLPAPEPAKGEKASESDPEKPPLPPSPPSSRVPVPCVEKGADVEIALGERLWRIRGLDRNLSFDQMRVNVRVSAGEKYHIDTLDLYSARHRKAFVEEAAAETGVERKVLKRDAGRL